jgi:hypothetical protein
VLSVLRLSVPPERQAGLGAEVRGLLTDLAGRPGWREGRLVRGLDDERTWLLVTSWQGVGAYRRALGSASVKLALAPLLGMLVPGEGAFEEVLVAGAAGIRAVPSDRGR